MESFLEANRIVELSLGKLSTIRNGGDIPLRKTLLISRVLSVAQDEATSVQDTLLSNAHTSSNRHPSKLLASFSQNQKNIDDLPAGHVKTARPVTRRRSPIATPSLAPTGHVFLNNGLLPLDEEPMDFDNVSSLLGNILDDDSSVCGGTLREDRQPDNTGESVDNWSDVSAGISRPVSPGKRNYKQAFPIILPAEDTASPISNNFKRFKSSAVLDTSVLQSLPGFCGCLSSGNLQTAPFITYMFGKGFTHPSNPNSASCDWPIAGTSLGLGTTLSTLSNTSGAPILAF